MTLHTTYDAYDAYIIIVDAHGRHVNIYGLPDKSAEQVVKAFKQYAADHGLKNNEYQYINIDRIQSDAGTQFTSTKFKDFCHESGILLSLAAPKKQAQNHFAERSWQPYTTWLAAC